jgi:hypothetical protein
VSVHVEDINEDIVLTTRGLRHSLDRRFNVNAPVVLKAGETLHNSIKINELTPENQNADSNYVLVGGSPMMVGVIISKDRAGNDISKVRTLSARRDVGKLITDDSILYLSEDKKRIREWFQACGIQVPLGETKFGFIRRISYNPEFVNKKFSKRDTESISNRSLLANALESTAQNDIEKNKLAQYKKIELSSPPPQLQAV